jgi:phosphoribosylaminoimidazole-succinocarboxamide synthase
MGAYCFEKLEEKGIKTHYRGLVTPDGRLTTTKELDSPLNIMGFHLVNVIQPKIRKENGQILYDYSVFTQQLTNFLIPLEIIYRNSLPENSSVFRRLKNGLIKPEDLGLDHYPIPGERLAKPIFDVSTKLEKKDRYITWKEAQRIAGLSDWEVDQLENLLLKINHTITEIASKALLVNEDGKVEFAFDPERKLMVVDVVGTLDECRFTFKGLHISKEIARQYYRRTKWYIDVESAKREADAKGVKDWKSLCRSQPPPLEPELLKIISQIYMATANAFLERKLFDVPRLVDIVASYKDYLSERHVA